MINPLEALVLIVDDSSSMRTALARILENGGFKNLKVVEDGDQALDELMGHRYDLVVSDWDMPGLSGLDLLKAVRADSRMHCLPFLMITAKQTSVDIAEAMDAEVSDYVIKPFVPEDLVEKAKQLILEAGIMEDKAP